MNKTELFEKFKEMFPYLSAQATGYKKIGGRSLVIQFGNGVLAPDFIKGQTRIFLYIDESNWQFGTKLWRKRPDVVTNKMLNGDSVIENLMKL